MDNRYNYDELRAAAISPSATQEDINRLGEWFSEYGEAYWNGYYYDADGYKLIPLYDIDEDWELVFTGNYCIE